MPLAGGASNKAGNRYEDYWTVDKFLDVLEGKYDCIRQEPPSYEDRGFEFWLKKSDKIEFHQVKRQQSSRGQWSLSDLDSNGVLANFGRKLGDEQTECFFVSTQDALALGELAERARAANSFSEFRTSFLSSDRWTAEFSELEGRWQVAEEDLFHRLRRTFVEVVSERYLRKSVITRVASTLDGKPEQVFGALFEIAFSAVHREMIASDIWIELRSRGIRANRWSQNTQVLTAVDEQVDRYVSRLDRERIGGLSIEREEANKAIEWMFPMNSAKALKVLMLTGSAGEGKSGVMLQIANALRKRGTPLLSFRADTLNPAPTPDEVGRQLGLPASPTLVLADIAQGRPAVLLVDQLDAVSKVSGRNPHFFDCLLEIIEQADTFPNMRVVLACRRFDIENDDRFRKLISEQGIATKLPLSPFSDAVVKEAVTRLELDASKLTKNQLDLLRLPFHLSLLARVAGTPTAAALGFNTLHELLTLFWEEKRRIARERKGQTLKWNEIIDELCDYMSANQRLSMPMARLDSYRDDVQLMLSEHVLVEDRRQCSFFHERLFDDVFARRFVARGGSLTTWMSSDSQDLFRRAQVRQILQYLRDEDRTHYLHELDTFLRAPEIRFHLKWVVFAWLSQLADPSIEEWRLLSTLADRKPFNRRPVIDLLRHGVWFRLAVSNENIRSWLDSSNEEVINEAVDVLASNASEEEKLVCDLLKLHAFDSPAWVNRVKWVLHRANLAESRCSFDLFLEMIERGAFDRSGPKIRSGQFWQYFYDLETKNIRWGAEAIGRMLSRSLSVAMSRGEANPFSEENGSMPEDISADGEVEKVYRGAPVEFIREVLKGVNEIIIQNAESTATGKLTADTVWHWRLSGEILGLSSRFLAGVEYGLGVIAQNDPDKFLRYAAELLTSDYETLHFLVARGLAANGAALANEAADFLLSHEDHFSLGYMGDRYASVDLLQSITPFCEGDRLGKLETRILKFYPAVERMAGMGKSFGSAQHKLLGAVDKQRLSAAAKARLSELERKFGPAKVNPPSGLTGGIVPSPILPKALDKMNDDQWLKAITKYDTEVWRGHRLRGGPVQLSQNLYAQTKLHPRRFASLLERFPVNVHPYYISNLLRGLDDANAGSSLILQACQFAHKRQDKPFGQAICNCIGGLANETLSDSDLSMVSWYAVEDPDPDCKADEDNESEGKGIDRLSSRGLNSVRGTAANAIARLMHARPERFEAFRASIQRLANDCSPAVRSQAATTLIAALRSDRDFAVGEFVKMCGVTEALLETNDVEKFLHFALSTHFGQLESTLLRIMNSGLKGVQAAGGRRVALAALTMEEAHPLLERCLAGSEDLCGGAVEVLAANVGSANHRDFCIRSLLPLFAHSSRAVRKLASSCFESFRDEDFAQSEPLVRAFLQSPAFEENCAELFHTLDKNPISFETLTLAACEHYSAIAIPKNLNSDMNQIELSAGPVSSLVIRMYGQSTDRTIRDRCLDLIDKMLRLGTRHISEALRLVDR